MLVEVQVFTRTYLPVKSQTVGLNELSKSPRSWGRRTDLLSFGRNMLVLCFLRAASRRSNRREDRKIRSLELASSVCWTCCIDRQ